MTYSKTIIKSLVLAS